MDCTSLASHDSQRDGATNAEPGFRTLTGRWPHIDYQSRSHAPACEAQRGKKLCRQNQTLQFLDDVPRKAVRASVRLNVLSMLLASGAKQRTVPKLS